MTHVVVEKRDAGGWRVHGGDGYDAWSSDMTWAIFMGLRFAAEKQQPEPRFSTDIPRHTIEEARSTLRMFDKR
jgi:hypothetical protein